MADFKKLCKQLADDLSLWVECHVPPTSLPTEQSTSFRLLKDVYKALAEDVKTTDTSGTCSAPGGKLVQQVEAIIINGQACDHDEGRTARAAILACARWLDTRTDSSFGSVSARWLREEVECG